MTNRNNGVHADGLFLTCLSILIIGGLAALVSASAPIGFSKFHDSYHFVKWQLFLGIVPGIILFLIIAHIPYHFWQKYAWAMYGVALILLTLVFVPGVGTVINGHRSWLSLFGLSLQPSEIAKLSVILFMAHLLATQKYHWDDWQHSLLPLLTLIAPALLFIALEPDIGTLSIMVMIVFMILYLAAVPLRYLIILGCLGLVAFSAIIIVAPYRAQRITTFLHPELDPQGVGYHINQAFLAVGSGGFWGLGFGQSRQKFQYLPEVSADSIFAIIAEENGFLVSTSLVILILMIGWRGLRISKHAPDQFGYLLVGGIMVWWMWQSFLNIGAMVGVVPLTGVPLPFVSHGGTAMVAALGAAGLVVSVSKETLLRKE